MSALLLYALIDAEARPAALPAAGLEGRPLRKIACGSLAGIVSDHEHRPQADLGSLWDYERVLEQVIERTAMLPLRYGTSFTDEHELVSAVVAREESLRAALERVRGAVEIAVRAPAEDRGATEGEHRPDETGSSPGLTYMRERLEARQRSRRLARELELTLDGLVRAQTQRRGGAHALLVERAHVEEVARRARALGLVASGPWPPFSFTGATGEAGELT
jgi:hypothetical protein